MKAPLDAVRDPDTGLEDLLRVLQAVLQGRVAADPPVAWTRFLPLARRHHLDAFLFDAVAAWPAGCRPPPEILADWKRLQRVRAVEAVRNQEQRTTLLAALKAADVPAIPLKGAWLAEQVYADIVQRPMSDIDLLIRPEQANAAFAALTGIGYRSVNENRPGDWGKEQMFRHPDWRCPVEMQWQLWHPTHGLLPPQDMTRLWASAGVARIGGVEVPVLSPAAHLVYLAYHIQAHQWRFPARAHLDIVLLGRRFASVLTVEALAAEAAAWGLGVRAPFVWRVAHDLCGVDPPEALAAWVPGDGGWMAAELRAARALALPGALARGVTMSRLLCEYRQAPGWRRVVLGLRAIFVSPAQIRDAFPACTRWGGLAAGYTARLADLIRRRLRDLVPVGRHRRAVGAAVADHAARLRLERDLQASERLYSRGH